MLAVIGSANFDFTIKLPKLPKEGETISGGELYTSLGGKGLNQAICAKRMGEEVIFVGAVGNDDFGEAIKSKLKEEGINVKIKTVNSKTGCAFIMVNDKGRNAIGVAPGANKFLEPDDVKGILADIVISQFEIPIKTIISAFMEAKERDKITVLNPAPPLKLPPSLIALSDFIIPNEVEAETLTGVKVEDEKSAENACNVLIRMGARNAIITMGDKGCFYKGEEGNFSVEAFKVDVVDTTAAGDAFIGAFCATLKKGIRQAILFASAASAICVTRKGAISSIPSLSEVENFLDKWK